MSSRPSRGAARLAAILDALPDALLLVNCNGTVVNANTIALETFECPGTALVGRGLLDLLPSFDSKRIPGSMRLPEDDEGRTRPTRMVARRTDGTEFPVEVTSANLEDGRTPYADSSLNHYTGDELLMLVVRDLSGTVDAEAELARQQRQTEMILRAAAEGVVGVDTDGKVVLVNPSAAQILGYRASDLGGKELHPLIQHSRPDGSPLPYQESPLANTLRSGRKYRVRGQVLWAKDGRAVPVDLTTAPVRDGDQLVGAVMTFTDRRPYDTLAARHAQLLSVLDTSLRGPLEQLRSELGTLASDPAGQLWPEANQILHYLTAGYARMSTLVDNVLSFQQLDAGRERLQPETVSLDAVVAAGVEGAVDLIGPGRAQFAVHAPPIEAEVDAGRLAQALAHLIADVAGVDATGNAPVIVGSGDSTIVVAAAQRGTVVRIEVRGPHAGGDPVHQPIVRGIVQRHGGVLQTHDVPGTSGSAYVLEVPLAAGAAVGRERQSTTADRENATTVMPVPKQPARGTAGAEERGTGSGSGANAGASEGVGVTGAGAAQPTGSPAPTGRRRARRSAEERDATAGTDTGSTGSAVTDAITGSVAVEPHAPHDGSGMPDPAGPSLSSADGPAGARTSEAVRPTGRRRGRPSPAETQAVPPGGMPQVAGPTEQAEGAASATGPRSGRRARRGADTDHSYGSSATSAARDAGQEQSETGGHGTGVAAQNGTPYVVGANGTGIAVPPQGTAPKPQTSAEPSGRQPHQGPRPVDGPDADGLGLVQLRPAGRQALDGSAESADQNGTYAAGVNGSSTAVSPEGTGPEPPPSMPAEPTGRRARRAATPAHGTQAASAEHGTPTPSLAAATGAAPETSHRNRPQPPPQPHGQNGAGPALHQTQPGTGRPTVRRARRALADGGDRAVPGEEPADGERQVFALPPAAADRRSAPSTAAGQSGEWPTDERGRHDPTPPGGVHDEHTPPQAHPVPPVRRHARSDPSEGQQAQGAPAQEIPHGATPPRVAVPQGGAPLGAAVHGTPPQGTGAPGAPPAAPSPQALSAKAPASARVPTPPQPLQAQQVATGPAAAVQSRAISVRTLGQGVPFAQQIADQQRPQPSVGPGRRRRLAPPPEEGERERPATLEPAARLREQQQAHPPPLLDTQGGRAYAIGAPDEGAEGPEPLDGPNGAIDVTDSQGVPPMDEELPPEPLDNPRRLLVWPAPDVSTQQALSDRGYRPVIVHSREEVDAQIAAYPAALFVDPLTGPITRTALQSLRTAAVAAEVPVLVTAGLGQATREAAYGADPAVLLKALAPRDSEQHPSRVLLIETHAAIAGALSATLERRGMQVARAASDADAVTLAAQMRPNLVVMDLMQVRRRRAGIVDWLRANGLLSRTPLVVYTSADIDPAELPRLGSGETVLFLAERSTSAEVQARIVDVLAKVGAN